MPHSAVYLQAPRFYEGAHSHSGNTKAAYYLSCLEARNLILSISTNTFMTCFIRWRALQLDTFDAVPYTACILTADSIQSPATCIPDGKEAQSRDPVHCKNITEKIVYRNVKT